MTQIETMYLLNKLDRDEILEVLSDGGLFCQHCDDLLQTRVLDRIYNKKRIKLSMSKADTDTSERFWSSNASRPSYVPYETLTVKSINSQQRGSWTSSRTPESVYTARRKVSPQSMNSRHHHVITNGGAVSSSVANNGISNEENAEKIRVAQVGRKKDFYHMERVNDKSVNVLQGLELHTKVFNADEQKQILGCVYDLQRVGQNRKLRERTYSEPRKWMRGKGRVTMQFGCCYNYAVDKDGNPPGIVRDEEVDPLPPLFKQMIKRMVKWQVLPSTCVPDSCIVNIYDEGDCIPPHIDHHDFVRPFCTVSFLTECNILFGSNLKIVAPGEFSGPVSIPLPVGSVLVLNGNGADVAKHCVPAVPTKRISITFRKMDKSKLPYRFSPDPELIGLKPIGHSSGTNETVQQHSSQGLVQNQVRPPPRFAIAKDEFPPLGSSEFPPLRSSGSGNKQKNSKAWLRRFVVRNARKWEFNNK